MGSEECKGMELALGCVQWRALLLAILKLLFLLLDTSLVLHCGIVFYFKYCMLSLRFNTVR